MNRKLVFALLFLLLFAWLPGCDTAPAPPAPDGPVLALSECQLSTPGLNVTVKARCGTLSVPENRAEPAGRQLALHVAVVPAVSRSPQPDALYILAGGPGQSVVEVYPALAESFRRIRQERDIVLVDQRGTGQSNPLQCALPEEEDADMEAVIAAMQACPETLDADLRFYTTEIAMHDLDAVREALGHDAINLYGASYGTRAALTYLRLFPNRVRSLVLDAVVSPDYRLYLNTGQDADRALDLLVARCAADAACNAAFPDWRGTFADLLARLDAAPITTTLSDPVSGEPVTLTLERADVLNMVFPLLYTPEIAALLPLNVQQAAAGDFAPLLAQAGSMDAGLYLGMFYAVACTEDAPFIDAAQAATLAEDALFGDRTTYLRQVCASWPRGELSTGFGAPVQSDAPVLLLSGEVDPVTPPHYAARVAEMLPNSLHIVGPGMGHGLMGRGCINALVTDFVATGSVDGLDPACAQQLAPPPFFLSPTGPQP
jgi:pimeloyl-ACP methyl ester carboxylesterase